MEGALRFIVAQRSEKMRRNINDIYIVGDTIKTPARLRKLKISKEAIDILMAALRIGRPAVRYGVPIRRNRGPR